MVTDSCVYVAILAIFFTDIYHLIAPAFDKCVRHAPHTHTHKHTRTHARTLTLSSATHSL